MSSEFEDERLIDRVAYKFRSASTWFTTDVALLSGHDSRNAERSIPKYRFWAPYDRIPPAQQAVVMAAFNACMGKAISFRFKDRADFELADVIIGISDGSVDEQMQIVKPYAFGTRVTNRPIKKPVDSTKYNKANGYFVDSAPLTVTADDVPISPGIDYDTGFLTLNQSAAEVIRVTGEFDVPVHFDADILEMVYTTHAAHSADIVLLEDLGA